MSKLLVVWFSCALGAVAPPRALGAAAAGAADWMIEDSAGVLLVRLAHAEPTRRPDGGVLRIDPNRRVVAWDGVDSDVGCRRALEVPFSRVRAVRVEPQGVLRVEVRDEPRDRWVFVPLPHAAWLARPAAAVVRGFLPDMRDTLVSGPRDDGPMPASGSAAFMGAQVRTDLVPADVAADVRLAVERMRQALGRSPLPSATVNEALHGSPLDVTIPALLEAPAALEGRAVRVRGVVERVHGRGLVLVDGDAHLRVAPAPEIAAVVGAASRDWAGEEVEVAGVVQRAPGGVATGEPEHEVVFWEYEGPAEGSPPADEVRRVSVRDVVERAEALAGQTVRVVGSFRGRNLYRDLEGSGPRGGWVLKAKRHAVWVIGHGPSGRGFRLDPHVVGDTTRWVEVLGTVEARDGRPVLRALRVSLAAPATFVWNGPRLRTSDPRPEVVFTLPVAGDEVPARDGRLLVQFSGYIDEESLEDRVRVRWGAGPEPDHDAARARFTYDAVRRVLLVDPAEPLASGGSVELQLLPGIEDVHGAPLEAPPGAPPGAPARVLRWRVSSGAAANAAP